MKKHRGHLLMCVPMIIVGAVLVIGGAGLGAIVPVIACVLIMSLMMGNMGHAGHDHGASR